MLRPPAYLFVCTANVNRSPCAAAWAQRILATEHFIAARIESASVMGWSGSPVSAYMTDAMRELGFDLREHRARALREDDVDLFDRILVMEPMHTERILALRPDAAGKVSCLARWQDPPAEAVSDPHGGTLDEHREAARTIGEAVRRLIPDLLAERRARRRA